MSRLGAAYRSLRPVALSLVAVLHFLTAEQDPYGVVATLVDALAPGSFVVASHVTTDLDPVNMERALEVYRQSGVFARPAGGAHGACPTLHRRCFDRDGGPGYIRSALVGRETCVTPAPFF